MSDTAPEAFDLEQAYMSLFIQNSRIYDVLMALLTVSDPAKAADVLELHKDGFLIASVPAFNGTFITSVTAEAEDVANSDDGTNS